MSEVNHKLRQDLGIAAPDASPPAKLRDVAVLVHLQIAPIDPTETPEQTKGRVFEWLRNADEIGAIKRLSGKISGERVRVRWTHSKLFGGAIVAGTPPAAVSALAIADAGNDWNGQVLGTVTQVGQEMWEARVTLSSSDGYHTFFVTREDGQKWLLRAVDEQYDGVLDLLD